jgi:3'(2'), 5'-bisphosphate nucleotidase
MNGVDPRLAKDDELDLVVEITRRAAALVMGRYQGSFTVSLKGPGDPVTEADREANELICAELAREFPHAAVVAEESVPRDAPALGALLANPEIFFVDPLDGTREFVERNGQFAVMIGLVRSGRAMLGTVAIPAEGLLLAGRVGGPAFAERDDGTRRPLAVSAASRLRGARLVVSRSRPPSWLEALGREAELGPPAPLGSVGVKVGRLVQGLSELYVHAGATTKLWDCCGPAAVLTAAGGCLTDLAGQPIDYAAPDLCLRRGILGSNGALHPAAVAAIARAGGVAS